jgi:hypothetical protein
MLILFFRKHGEINFLFCLGYKMLMLSSENIRKNPYEINVLFNGVIIDLCI